MARVQSEYDVEARFIERLGEIGFDYVELKNYEDVVENFRTQLAAFNAEKLIEAKGEASLSDTEFSRIMIHVDNKSVYESAKILRDKFILPLDNGKTAYIDFFSHDTDRNYYQVTVYQNDRFSCAGFLVMEYDIITRCKDLLICIYLPKPPQAIKPQWGLPFSSPPKFYNLSIAFHANLMYNRDKRNILYRSIPQIEQTMRANALTDVCLLNR